MKVFLPFLASLMSSMIFLLGVMADTDDSIYYSDGDIGVNTRAPYYTVSSIINQESNDYLCFTDNVGYPASVVAEYCPNGAGSLSFTECQTECEALGYTSLAACPINQAGCCQCPYLSFKYDPNDSEGGRYDFNVRIRAHVI